MSELRAAAIAVADEVVIPLLGRVNLPEPPVPADADLRDYDYMKLFGEQLFNSEFDAIASDAEFRAGLRLWWHAFRHEIPAGSLPDNDVLLAKAAGFGRDIPAWQAVRSIALHGFYRCSDGRLYHRIVAERVLDALSGKRKGKKAADKRWGNEPDPPAPARGTRPAMHEHCLGIAHALPKQCQGEGEGDGQGKGELPLGFSSEKPSGEGVACATQPAEPTPLPPDFNVPQEWKVEAAEARAKQGLPVAALAFQAEKFVNHHRAKGTLSRDWRATWRNWALEARASPEAAEAAERYGPAPPGERAGKATEPIAHALGDGGDALRERLGAPDFQRWFGDAEAAIDADGSVTLLMPTRFMRNWAREHFGPAIEAAWPGRRVAITIRGAPAGAESSEAPP